MSFIRSSKRNGSPSSGGDTTTLVNIDIPSLETPPPPLRSGLLLSPPPLVERTASAPGRPRQEEVESHGAVAHPHNPRRSSFNLRYPNANAELKKHCQEVANEWNHLMAKLRLEEKGLPPLIPEEDAFPTRAAHADEFQGTAFDKNARSLSDDNYVLPFRPYKFSEYRMPRINLRPRIVSYDFMEEDDDVQEI